MLEAFLGPKTFIVLCAGIALACTDIAKRIRHRPSHLLFAAVVGTALSIGLLRITDVFLQGGVRQNGAVTALAVVLIVLCWRALFGPWETQTKATMLGAFVFWICVRLFLSDTSESLSVRLIAVGTALVPAVIWCMLFLKYHRERLGSVLLLFLSGMLSTVPILFYDLLVRRGAEMQFFLFRLTPESFSQTTQSFVSGQLSGADGSRTVIFATLFSFLMVGIIEETSKFWVLSRSGRNIFTGIDDVLQLAIVVAIGFAFAENIVNPVYFVSFVRDYLFHGAAPDVVGFVSNVVGRSVLTSMVHILSTGVAGYFLGLAIFATPYLAQRKAEGRAYRALSALHRLFRLKEVSIFRVQMLVTGLLAAIALHAIFNFLVTLPDILPSHPQTIADIIGPAAPALLQRIPFLLIPSLLYVVGGFWLLTTLFLRKESMKEYGHLVMQEEFVEEMPVEA